MWHREGEVILWYAFTFARHYRAAFSNHDTAHQVLKIFIHTSVKNFIPKMRYTHTLNTKYINLNVNGGSTRRSTVGSWIVCIYVNRVTHKKTLVEMWVLPGVGMYVCAHYMWIHQKTQVDRCWACQHLLHITKSLHHDRAPVFRVQQPSPHRAAMQVTEVT